ncbi:HAD family hydrolase [Candidatus Korobacter versatilis]|uniref:HAD family hydrolase n=1 Tax=Candidatus Korobacter versatilis TaxID=658062 RepID=UPI0005A48851|nr:HAD family hydrolase [Candidatus Koribacter versatilis]
MNVEVSPRALRLFVFDLDDTLYAERDYVRSGFAHIARITADSAGIPAEDIEVFLWDGFNEKVRGNAFDLLLTAFPEIAVHWTVGRLIEEYRGHKPSIATDPTLKSLLRTLRQSGSKIGVLTDGPVQSQRSKYNSLQLAANVDIAIFNDEFGVEYRKPNERGFRAIMSAFHFPPEMCVYVGDNPEKDFYAPRRLGWHSVRLRLPSQLRHELEPASADYFPDLEFNALAGLVQYLENCCHCSCSTESK